MAADAPAEEAAAGADAAEAPASGEQQGQAGQQDAPAAAAAHRPADEVAVGLSRLSMAAETSSVPSVVSFGRGRGRGLAGVGRGRGGQKAAHHALE